MTADTRIRPATLADIGALVTLLAKLFSIEEDFTFDETKQRLGLELLVNNREDCCIIVAEVEGGIVGMCSVQTLISTAEGGRVGLVEDLIVAKQHRGKGIGAKLLRTIEQWSHDKGLKRLQLLADKNNSPGLDFYGKSGWSVTQLICLRKKQF